jgi:TPP-dependent pyruvate/acetoin dehydrogenase alpha subunit
MIKNLEKYPVVREVPQTKEDLIAFEDLIVSHWEGGKIRGPVHLSNGNEEQLIEIFKRINKKDWVFSTWRSHYHTLFKDITPNLLERQILDGKSITICKTD